MVNLHRDHFGAVFMSLSMSLSMILLALCAPQGASAQDSAIDPSLLEAPRPDYLGVRPGHNNYAPGKKPKAVSGRQVITWVGFQAKGDRARVFIQTDGNPIYEVASSAPDRVVLDFPSAKLHTRNDSRGLDTAFFPTVVRAIYPRQLGKQLVRVVIKLREPARYRLKKEGSFVHLYFDPPKEPIDVIAERERELELMEPREGDVAELKRRRSGIELPEDVTDTPEPTESAP
jgi:hypothetical protein